MRTSPKVCARRHRDVVHGARDVDQLQRARESGGWVTAYCGLVRYVAAGEPPPDGLGQCPLCIERKQVAS